MELTPGTAAMGQATLTILFILAIIVIVNILILKLVTKIVTNTVIDTLEARGYGKGTWKH